MKKIVPLLVLCVLLAGCNGSDDAAAEADEAAGGLNFPVAVASDLAPPADNALPADLLPPS